MDVLYRLTLSVYIGDIGVYLGEYYLLTRNIKVIIDIRLSYYICVGRWATARAATLF